MSTHDPVTAAALAVQQPPPGSLARRRALNTLVIAAQASKKIWNGGGDVDRDLYDEALQNTWAWACKRIDDFDPNLASFMTWFNNKLKFHILDLKLAKDKEARRRQDATITADGEILDVLDQIPSLPPSRLTLEDIEGWLNEAAAGLQKIHIRAHPQANCHYLLRERVLLETPWKALSEDLQIKIPTLSGFFQRQCLPPLQKFLADHDL